VTTYSFCPVCGGGSLTAGTPEVPPTDVLVCGACGFHFWLNSKPAVGAFITRRLGGAWHVLLTRRGIEPYKGMWDAPGGFLGNGEQPEDGLRRELREELGVEISGPRFLTAYVDQYPRDDVAEQARFVLSLFYRCDIPKDTELVPADDIVEARWFALDSPPADLAFEANRKALKVLRKTIEKKQG
jgi:ADP-ribose pyrophosphatase YjhB (NUDIX family)/ribosomal protein S27AE